jgi:hypothetical protein
MIRLLQAIVALLFATQVFVASASAQSECWMTVPPPLSQVSADVQRFLERTW